MVQNMNLTATRISTSLDQWAGTLLMEDMVVGAASPVDQHVAGAFPKNPSANRDAGFRGKQHVRPGRTDPPNRSPQRHLAAMTRQVRHLVRPPAGRAQRRVGDRRRLRARRRRKSTKSLLRFPACPDAGAFRSLGATGRARSSTQMPWPANAYLAVLLPRGATFSASNTWRPLCRRELGNRSRRFRER